MKDQANELVKAAKHAQACEKYFEAITTLRFSDKHKNSSEGKALETACRLNIAVCKQTMGEYTVVVDQCERVLNQEPDNWKAQYRLSLGIYSMIKQKNQALDGPEMKMVVEYA